MATASEKFNQGMEKASTTEAQTGQRDDLWMSPLKTRQSVDFRLAPLQDEIFRLSGGQDSNQSEIDVIRQQELPLIRGSINAIETDVTNIQSNVSTLQTDVGNVQTDITSLQETVSNIDSTRTTDTVADAINSDAQIGEFLETKGYNTAGDGGANQYEVVAAGTGVNDGGLYINMVNGNQLKGLFLSGRVNTMQWGVSEKKIYVATDGLSTAQGTLETEAFDRPSNAFKWFTDLNSSFYGQWIIEIAAGGYTAISNELITPYFETPLIIQGADVGGHPNVPTTVFGPNSGTVSGYGIVVRGGNVVVKDIKFKNLSGNSSSFGLAMGRNGLFKTENVHADNCSTGLYFYGQNEFNITGGIVENCPVGALSIFNAYHEVGDRDKRDVNNGPIFRNNQTGFAAREGSTGHASACLFENNTIGVNAEMNSRVHADFSDFRNNSLAIRARYANVLYTDAEFNDGTALSNNENVRVYEGALDLQAEPYSLSKRVYARDLSFATTQGSINETTLKTVTFPEGFLKLNSNSTYFGKAIKIHATGDIIGFDSANYQLSLKLNTTSGTALCQVMASKQGPFEIDFTVYVENSTSIRTTTKLQIAQEPPRLNNTTGVVVDFDVAGEIDFVFTGQNLAFESDAIRIETFSVEVEG